MKVKITLDDIPSIPSSCKQVRISFNIISLEDYKGEFTLSTELEGKEISKKTKDGNVDFEINSIPGTYTFYVKDQNEKYEGAFKHKLEITTSNSTQNITINAKGSVNAYKSFIPEKTSLTTTIAEKEMIIQLKPTNKYELDKICGETGREKESPTNYHSPTYIEENDPNLKYIFRGRCSKNNEIINIIAGVKLSLHIKKNIWSFWKEKEALLCSKEKGIEIKNIGANKIQVNERTINPEGTVYLKYEDLQNLNCKDLNLKLHFKKEEVRFSKEKETKKEEYYYAYGFKDKELLVWLPYGKQRVISILENIKEGDENPMLKLCYYEKERHDIFLYKDGERLKIATSEKYEKIESELPNLISIQENPVEAISILADGKSILLSPYTSKWILGRKEPNVINNVNIYITEEQSKDSKLNQYWGQISNKHMQINYKEGKSKWYIQNIGRNGIRISKDDYQKDIGNDSQEILEGIIYLLAWGSLSFNAKIYQFKTEDNVFPVLKIHFNNCEFTPMNDKILYIFVYGFPLGFLFDEEKHPGFFYFNEGEMFLYALNREDMILNGKKISENINKLKSGDKLEFYGHKLEYNG